MSQAADESFADTSRQSRRGGGGLRWINWRVRALLAWLAGGSARFRITLGLVGILSSLVMLADLVGLFPDRIAAVRAGRIAMAETMAVNATAYVSQSDLRRLKANLAFVAQRNTDVLSAVIRREDGTLVTEIGDHVTRWRTQASGDAIESEMRIPIWAGSEKWGHLELRFSPLTQAGWTEYFSRPLIQFMAFLIGTCFLIYYFYLGRMLTALNPSQAIPSRVRSTLDTIAEGLLVVDKRERVVLANQAFSSLLDKHTDQLLGLSVSNFDWTLPGDEPLNSMDAPWRTAIIEGTPQLNQMIRLQLSPTVRRTFMVNCSPIMATGGMVGGVLISFDDVTELEEKEIELRKSKEQADAANRSKSEFLANMSHEIRTPMNAILGFTEVLKRGVQRDPAETNKHLNTIHSSGQYLLNLINDILDLSKVEAGNLEIERIPCPVHELILETVKVLGVKAREKGIDLSFEAEGALPEKIQSDPVRLRQIITNLIGNSIKFTEQGGVRIVARMTNDAGETQLAIDVIDTGIGMTPAQAERIFEPFSQADTSITRRFGGTGLGLSISKRFTEAMGGAINVSSKPGKGSHFTVTVDTGPLDGVRMISPEEATLERDTVVAEHTLWQFPSARVLVVDDGEENRSLVKIVCEEVGLTVETAENGQIGVDMSRAKPYDLILMDVSMPQMDGYTATRILRDEGVKTPIVALTAHAMADVEQKCLEVGYSAYMSKPIDIDKLLGLAAGYLGGQAAPGHEKGNHRESVEADDAPTSSIPEETIASTLATDNPRVQALVERFIEKLRSQITVMEGFLEAHDYAELVQRAHWLKGAGGTAGFDILSKLGQTLEQHAQDGDLALIEQALNELRNLSAQVVARPHAKTEDPSTPTAETNDSNGAAVTPLEPIRSSILHKDPRMRPLVERFIVRLNEQLTLMEIAYSDQDFEGLAGLAHWLKGAGGTVGFEAFTDPAQQLEHLARARREDGVRETIDGLTALSARIMLTDDDTPGSDAFSTPGYGQP